MRSLIPIPLTIPTYRNREIRQLQSEVRSLIAKSISQTKGQRGVVSIFKDDPDVIDHCMTFLFAGHETTASSLAFTLMLLAQNSKYQDAVAAGDGGITMLVYKESIRLFPPAYMLAREATVNDNLFGVRVRKSDQVIVGVSSLHRNKTFFERSDDFLPERFRETLRHPFSFLPFGAGPKSCVGERLAYLEAGIILKEICQTYILTPLFSRIAAEPLITLHPASNQILGIEKRFK